MKIKTHIEEMNLKGPVSMIEESDYNIEYHYPSGQRQKNRANNNIYSDQIFAFNKTGNLIWSKVWESAKSTFNEFKKSVYLYDKMNRLIKTETFFNDVDTISTITIMEYNSQNLLVKQTTDYAEGGIYITNFHYNDSLKPAYKVTYNNKRRTDSTIYNYIYQLNEETRYLCHDYDTVYSKQIIQYDQFDRMICLDYIFGRNNGLNYRERYSYNENGDLFEESRKPYDTDANYQDITRYKYEYDMRGNWVSKTTVSGVDFHIESHIVERKISYFPDE